MQVLDKLFSLAEQDQLGGQALRFLGLLPEPPQKTDGNDGEEKEEAQEEPKWLRNKRRRKK